MLPQFWTGPTGRSIRKAGKEAQLLAAYVLSSPRANSLGLYHLPEEYIQLETALTGKETRAAIESLCALKFIFYDYEYEFIWVVEMAKFQIGELSENDNRVIGANREYVELSHNPFLPMFYDKYCDLFHLEEKREFNQPLELFPEGAIKPLVSSFGAPPKPKISKDKISQVKKRDEKFEEFWVEYPRDGDKGAAFAKWKTALSAGASCDDLILAASNYRATVEQEGTEEKYMKLAKTFLGPTAAWKEFVAGPKIKKSKSYPAGWDAIKRFQERHTVKK